MGKDAQSVAKKGSTKAAGLIFGCLGFLLGGKISIILCLVVALLGVILGLLSGKSSSSAAVGGGGNLVANALRVSQHLSKTAGGTLEVYDPANPAIVDFVKGLSDSYCGGGDVRHCNGAAPGDLECVAFVKGVLAMSGKIVGAIGNAEAYWDNQSEDGLKGWLQIPNGELPMPGDIMVWDYAPYGHVAIVVDVVAPKDGNKGKVVFAHGNAAGWSKHPWTGELTLGEEPIETNGQVTDSWGHVAGYRRPPIEFLANMPIIGGDLGQILPKVFQGVTEANKRFIPLAVQYGGKWGLPNRFYTIQVWQESKYNPNAGSGAGALGIGQFMPATARGHINQYGSGNELCHDNTVGDAPDRSAWPCVDAALNASARYMSNYQKKYIGQGFDLIGAFQLALVSYNAGDGRAQPTASCLQSKGQTKSPSVAQVVDCFPFYIEETAKYLEIIMI